MDIKERAAKIIAILRREYPDAKCSLDYSNPLELLVATILAAQCTDERVNIVTKTLFRKYPVLRDYARASQPVLEQDIRSTGFFRNKAKNIIRCAQALETKFGGNVPSTMEELTQLAGVGRKTANVLLGNVFDTPGVVVDTHVSRLSQRLKLTKEEDPVKIESDLCALVLQKDWTRFSHWMVWHGRKCCTARSPNCPGCPIQAHCPSKGKVS